MQPITAVHSLRQFRKSRSSQKKKTSVQQQKTTGQDDVVAQERNTGRQEDLECTVQYTQPVTQQESYDVQEVPGTVDRHTRVTVQHRYQPTTDSQHKVQVSKDKYMSFTQDSRKASRLRCQKRSPGPRTASGQSCTRQLSNRFQHQHQYQQHSGK